MQQLRQATNTPTKIFPVSASSYSVPSIIQAKIASSDLSQTNPMPRPNIDLDKDTEARLQGVRKELWWGGLQGLVFGTTLGLAGHFLTPKFVPSLGKKLNRNTLLATVLITGSIGSFIGAVTYGKNAVQYVGDIFRRNSVPTSTYRGQLNQNEKSIIDSFDEAYQNRKDAISKAMQNKNERG